MRRLLLVLAMFVLGAMAPTVQAQPYPDKLIRIIVPYPPGGATDILARILAEKMTPMLGQTVIVENRAGASGNIGFGYVAKAEPDGYTLLMGTANITISPAFYDNLPYNVLTDFAPVATVVSSQNLLVIRPELPAQNLKELIAYIKANPGKLNYGSSGVGSTHHLSMEALKSSLGLVMTHVPFKGTSESVPALLGGHVDVAFSAYPSLSGAVGTKNITLLATNGAKRSAMAPDVPAVAEFIPGYAFAPTIGIYARTGTPPAIMAKIASEVAAIVKEPEIIKQFATAGIEPAGGGPKEYAEELKREDERVAKTVKAAGMTPQ